jgi:riboflavin kinase/FMN adenylyltransferase
LPLPTAAARSSNPNWFFAMPDAGDRASLANGSVITVGTFDGVHLGHRDILRTVRERAAAKRLAPAVVTFRPHPLEVVNPSAAPMLLTPEDEQLDALAEEGPLEVIVLPFTQELARLSAEEFVVELLRDRYQMRELVIGYDHGLGRGRQGDATALKAIGAANGFTVDVVPATLDASGVPISSSAIRTFVAHGDLDRASRALGRPYGFRGVVVPGNQRGRDIGYPTLNIQIGSARKLLPPEGVYAVRAHSARGTYGGMMNLGPRPTFDEFDRTLEVHLFDVTGDWYGERISVELIRRLRDTTRFTDVNALVAQLARDAANARHVLAAATNS